MLCRGWAALAVVGVLATHASAQPASDEFGIERFRLATDREGLLDVESGDVLARGSWSAGVVFGLAHDPLVVYDSAMQPVDALVDRRLTIGLVGAYSVHDRVSIGVGADIVGYQRGSDASPTMRALPAGGLGDLRLVPKLVVLGGGVNVSIVPVLTVPGGAARGYLRESGVTFAPMLAASKSLDPVRVAANIGYRFKPRIEVAGLTSNDEAFVAVAAAMRFGSAEASLSTTVTSQEAAELFVGGNLGVNGTIDVFVAGGIGLDRAVGVPDWRALVGVRVAKATAAPPAKVEIVKKDVDSDGDGLLDSQDKCAGEGEDKDGFQDDDGCPDPKAKLAGRVVDVDGRPIPNASVTIELSSGAPIEVTADTDGKFSAELDGGAVKVRARAPEYKDGSFDTTVAVGGSGEVSVQLARAVRQGQLRGQVLSFAGKPLAATITVKGKTGEPATTTTDGDGQYTVELPEGAFEVTIESPGHTTQKRNVSVKLDGVTVLNVDLRGAK